MYNKIENEMTKQNICHMSNKFFFFLFSGMGIDGYYGADFSAHLCVLSMKAVVSNLVLQIFA